ncbi:MAG: hypothetical protein EP338_04830 [Bacteroidetes bacterium]|nr:MAG: hypothetical protein EP338_04830 [Bacteroidota bacterium]
MTKRYVLVIRIKLGILACLLSFTALSQRIDFSAEVDYIVEDTVKYTYEMIEADLGFFKKYYPEWVHEEKVGKSQFGLELYTIRIGKGEAKKNSVFLVGNIHAREDYSSKFLMKFTNVLLLNLAGKDTTYRNIIPILDSMDLYIMPVANPDGLKIAHLNFKGIEKQFAAVKDSIIVIETLEEWKANGIGIDINTSFDDGNHSVKKGDTYQESPASEGYKGKFPAEPIETRYIQDFVKRKQPLFTASFHTKGNIIFWADGGTHTYFLGLDEKINLKATSVSGFRVAHISKNPESYGCGLENYVRARLGLLGSCVELSSPEKRRKQFPDANFNKEVWQLAWKIPEVYITEAYHNRYMIREISKRVQAVK